MVCEGMNGRDGFGTYSARKPRGFGAPVSPSLILGGVVVRVRRRDGTVVVVEVVVSRRRGRERDDADCMARYVGRMKLSW